MKKTIIFCLVIFSMLLLGSLLVQAKTLTAEEILAKVDQIRYPIDSSFIIKCQMFIYRDNKVESRKDMEISVQDPAQGNSVLVKFVYPTEDYGKAILSVDDQNWLYFPNTRKTIKISPQYTLMGGDFSNGDVTKIRLSHDYTGTIVGEEELFGMNALVLELTAKNSKSVYQHLKLWVNKENYLPLKQEIFTASGKAVKTLVYIKFEKMAGEVRPVQMMMTDALQSSKKTVMVFKSIERAELKPSMFTTSYLESSN